MGWPPFVWALVAREKIRPPFLWIPKYATEQHIEWGWVEVYMQAWNFTCKENCLGKKIDLWFQ